MFCIRRKDKCIKIWDKTSLTCKKSITALNDWVNVLTEVKKGLLASGGRDNLVKLWSLETFECTRTVEWHCNTIISLIKEEDDKEKESVDSEYEIFVRYYITMVIEPSEESKRE